VRPRFAVSLIEVLIALVVLGVVAAITIPRFSRAATPDPRTNLRSELQVLRCAIERYYQDHAEYPGAREDGRHPPGSPDAVIAQLTLYSDATGRVSETATPAFPFGPYLRNGIPASPVSPTVGQTGLYVINGVTALFANPAPPDAAWIYDLTTGQIAPNSAQRDVEGRAYSDY